MWVLFLLFLNSTMFINLGEKNSTAKNTASTNADAENSAVTNSATK